MAEESELWQRNIELKQAFLDKNLDYAQILEPSFDDLEQENERLENLLEWVEKYAECQDRETMETLGFTYPPVYPDFDPDSDWLRFELWVNGKNTQFRLRDKFPQNYHFKKPDDIDDEDELIEELKAFLEVFALFDVSADYVDRLPHRVAYEMVFGELDEVFDILGGGIWHLDGCSGFCPDCIQRPWCEIGWTLCFEEDETEGVMVFCDAAKRFACPTKISLQLLKENEIDDF